MINSVNVVIHSAASVDFSATMIEALNINVLGTLRVFELCKKLKNLNNFVQISTCYVNCDKSGIIEEEILDDAYEDPVELVK